MVGAAETRRQLGAEASATPAGARAWLLPALAIALMFAVSVLPYIFSGNGFYSQDEVAYYYPTIQTIQAHWPWWSPYRSPSMTATAPLFPYLLAALPARFIANLTALKLFNAGFSLAGLAVLGHFFARVGRRDWEIFLLCLPLLCSQCFLFQSIWLLTDGLAMLLLVVALCTAATSADPARLGGASLVGALATLTRQSLLWVGAPIGLAYVARSMPRDPATGRPGVPPPRVLLVGGLLLLPPILALGWLFHQWGGIVPPQWRSTYARRTSPCALSFSLSLFGLYALPWLIALGADWRRLVRSRATIPVVVLALVLWAAFPNDFDEASGRCQGMLWWLIRLGHAIHHRSLVELALAPVGAMAILYFALEAHDAGRGVFAAVMVSSLLLLPLACSRSPIVYQRYLDVDLLAMLAMLVAAHRGPTLWTVKRAAAPVALCVVTALLAHGRFLRWF